MRDNFLGHCAVWLVLAWLAQPAAVRADAPSGSAKPRLGLALSGGGARGLAHIGVLKVLEEAGLKPDVIAGTSMGAIVGAFYASGYSAHEIEAVILGQDWTALLSDRVSRAELSLEDKRDAGKYLGAFPIRQGTVTLPNGLTGGQNISSLLSRLLFRTHTVTDFRQLPIPFACLATDFQTGEPVVLDHGDLAESVRASSAIPFVFTPGEIGGRVLVDGGVTLDVPVATARDLGADEVIAVNVNSRLSPAAALDSLPKVLDQTLLIYMRESGRAQVAAADLSIQPEMAAFDLMSFARAQEIIDRGEAAARARWPELQALAARLGRTPAGDPKAAAGERPAETAWLAGIRIEGLRLVPRQMVLRRLNLRAPGRVTPVELEQAVTRVYGSRYFQRVTYRLEPAPEGETLVVTVVEDLTDQVRLGFRYDTETAAMVMVETAFRSTLGSALNFHAVLSREVILGASYFVQTGWKPGLGFGAELGYQTGSLALYDRDVIQAYLDQTAWRAEVLAQANVSNSLALGVGLEKEAVIANSALVTSGLRPGSVESLSPLAFLSADTLDRDFYPRSGHKITLTAKRVTPSLAFRPQDAFPAFTRLLWNTEQVVPLHRSVAVAAGLYGGATVGESRNAAHDFYLGGMTGLTRQAFPFLGMSHLMPAGANVVVGQARVQIEPWDDRYLILRANLARTALDYDELFTGGETLAGYGLTLGALTLIGPVEATVMSGSHQDGVSAFLNIGTPF